jgi:hypothetical protein
LPERHRLHTTRGTSVTILQPMNPEAADAMLGQVAEEVLQAGDA